MGVDKSLNKKKALKKIERKKNQIFNYFGNDEIFLKKLNNGMNGSKFNVIFDGAIFLEQAINQPNWKRNNGNNGSNGSNGNNGNNVFNDMIKPVKPWIKSKKISSIVFCLDNHRRPPIKDIDISRIYDEDARVFKPVTETNFPCGSHKNISEIGKILKTIKRNDKELSKIKMEKNDKQLLLKRIPKRIPKKKKKKKLKELKAKEAFLRKQNLKLRKKRLRLTEETKEIDIWKIGKGNKINRKMVYHFLTKKMIKWCYENLIPDKLFIIDCAIIFQKDMHKFFGIEEYDEEEEDDQKENYENVKYSSIWIRKEGSDFLLEKKESSNLCEGEQACIWYMENFIKTMGQTKFIIYSIDTDLKTYNGLNIKIMQSHNSNVKVYLRNRNWVKPKEKGNMYLVNFNSLTVELKRRNIDPYEFWYKWGILLSNDFVRGTHKLIQSNMTHITIDKTIEFLLSKNFGIVEVKRAPFDKISKAFSDFYVCKVYKKKTMKMLIECAWKISKKKLDEKELMELSTIIHNSEYVMNYMVNQRYKHDRSRMFANCLSKFKKRSSRFGYKREQIYYVNFLGEQKMKMAICPDLNVEKLF